MSGATAGEGVTLCASPPTQHPHQRLRREVHLLPRPHEVRRVAPIGVGDGLAVAGGDVVEEEGELGRGAGWGAR